MDCETPPLRRLAYSSTTLANYQLQDRRGVHGTLAIEIDRVALRLASTMLPALHTVCRTACEALCQDADAGVERQAAVQYTLN